MYNNLSPEQEERKEALLAAIEKIEPIIGFKVPLGFPVPLKDYILVKQIVGNKGDQKTEGGIIIPDTISNNTVIPFTGIIFAVGYSCSELLIPGHKIMYNPYADFTILINGIEYIRMQEQDVLGILPPDAWVHLGVKTEARMRREERQGDFKGYKERKSKKDENDLDEQTEKAKKKKS